MQPVFSLLEAELEDRGGVGGGGELRLQGDKVLKVSAKSLQTREKCFCQVTGKHPSHKRLNRKVLQQIKDDR